MAYRRPPGLMPSPEDLENYDAVVPGSAARIIELAEKEQKHRHRWENNALIIYQRSAYYGKLLGAIIVLGVLFTTYMLAAQGYTLVASVVALAGFGSLILAFLVSNVRRQYTPIAGKRRQGKAKKK